MAEIKDWKPEDWGEGVIVKRPYHDRREYVENQKAAVAKQQKALGRFSQDVKRFAKNFAELPFLLEKKKVLCLGVRTGAEVMAMRKLGNKAFGIDIEPVPHEEAEQFVIRGDFHNLAITDNFYDVIYTNSFDHCYDHKQALSEVKRILKDDGLFILEIVAGYGERGCPGDHEAMYWRTAEDFAKEVERQGWERIMPMQEVPYCKGLPFKRVILRGIT